MAGPVAARGLLGTSARATLRPYQPTIRDNAAAWLLDHLGNGPVAQRMVEGLMGSTGTGQTKPGVVDFIPGVGQALQSQEAGRQIGAGHPVAGLANLALTAIPVPMAAKAARGMMGATARTVLGDSARAAEAAAPAVTEAAQQAAPPIIAYHGSPHTFDAFDLSKVGTGEGAQAYGHGLYFAQNEDVARGYRDATRLNQQNAETLWDGSPYLHYEAKDELANVARQAGGYEKDASTPHKIAGEVLGAAMSGDDLDHMFKFVHQSDWGPQEKAGYASAILAAKDRLKINAPPGNMYQVGISAHPDHFLDWDKPFEEQHPVVQDALTKAGFSPPAEYLAPQYRTLGGSGIGRELQKPEEVAALSDLGVPGIKYLDGGSRGTGKGTSNFVVFDPKNVDILKRYGIAASVLGAGGAGAAAADNSAGSAPQT